MFVTFISAVIVCYGLIQVAKAFETLANTGITVYHKYSGDPVVVEYEKSHSNYGGWKVTVTKGREF